MRSKSILVILTALLLAACTICGCSSSSNNTTSQRDNSLSSAEVKIVVDAWGRSVKVPVNAQTAASVGSAARIVVFAGAQDKLIAVGELDQSDLVESPYTVAAADTFKDLPITNTGSNYLMYGDIDTDMLVELNPDVIISSASADACDALQEATGIPVVGVFYQNQLFTKNVIDSIECVGEALGTEDHAQAVVAKLQAWQEDLKGRTENHPLDESPLAYFGAVTYYEGHNWYGTYANYAPARAVNVRCAADELASDGYVEITLDDLVFLDPDYMFINSQYFTELQEMYVMNKATFDGLKAFQDGNLYTQPYFNFNGTDIATGICNAYFIGATIYPEAFADVDLASKYTEIYESMLNGFDFYTYLQSKGQYFGKFPTL